ncbi:MAG: hypothetical protein KF729_08960 [Sandaracinaceae bacterium]|nr:hypothetical protein [Sandaracinaceae bacterium]
MYDDRASRARAIASIERLDAVAFASVVGGLVLVPENLHLVHRLEVAANMVLAGRARGRGDVTRTRARRAIDELIGAWTGHNDDPWPNLATEAFVYHGGTHLFIPGGLDTIFILRAVARAVEACAVEHREFAERAARLIQFACAVSDDVLASVGAGRSQRVPPPAALVVPPDAALRRLRAAVHLRPDRFARLRRSGGIEREDAERFCVVVGSAAEPEALVSYQVLSLQPVARRGDDVVVIAPHLIGEAAVRNVLVLASELGATGLLAHEFHRTAWLMTDDALRLLGLTRSGKPRGEAGPTSGMQVTHTIYQCDRDKVHHVMLVSDALEGSARDAWDVSHLEEELQRAHRAFGPTFSAADPPIAAWSSIIVMAGIGRDFGVSFDHSEIPCWSASAADIETIAHAEHRDPLLLWKHMDALDEQRATTRLTSFSPLDTYAQWKEYGRRFARGIGPQPTMIVIAPDYAETLRYEAAAKRDWRALPSWVEGGVVEVALAEGRERPLYAPRDQRPQRLAVAVETQGPLVWLLSPAKRDLRDDADARRMCVEILRMAAFWLSEFTAALISDIRGLEALPPVVVEIDARPGTEPARRYEIAMCGDRRVRVVIGREFYEAYDATNRAEREFAADLTAAVLAAAGLRGAGDLVRGHLDAVAPIGVKRMLHAVRGDRHPSFVAADELPRPRYVSDHDVHRAVGVALGDSRTVAALRLEGGAAKDWLNAAVGRLYAALRERLALLDASDALDELLRYNEALVHEDDERDMTFASVLACAESTPELRRELEQRVLRHARAGVATRFLIEHVVAEVPRGTQRLSLAEFDRLLALAAEIIGLGVASDAIAFELAGPSAHVAVGATGYQIDLGGFETALDVGRAHVFRERLELEAGRTHVPGITPAGSSSKTSTEKLSIGVQAEFGRGLREIAHVFGELLALAQERETAVVKEPHDALVERLSTRLAWPRQDLGAVLAHLTLEPRVAFLTASPPYQGPDVWPWRFNRGLSYLRRPLVRRDDMILFTPGNVAQSAHNLIGLIVTGRFKAQTRELRAAMDSFTHAPAREFVEQVAATLEQRGLVVRAHVKKIGARRIERAKGQDAGDVDVLAADPSCRRIIAIECKDFQQDRMPHEIRADLDALFVGSSRKASAQALHLTRLRWLRERHDEVVAWLAGSGGEGWTIEAAIVTSRPLVSPHLGKAELPVWTLGQLRRGEGP